MTNPSQKQLIETEQQYLFVSVAISVPLRRIFEYKLPKEHPVDIQPGIRVEVPFAGRNKIGVIVKVSQTSEYEPKKIKFINQVIDETPLINQKLLKLID